MGILLLAVGTEDLLHDEEVELVGSLPASPGGEFLSVMLRGHGQGRGHPSSLLTVRDNLVIAAQPLGVVCGMQGRLCAFAVVAPLRTVRGYLTCDLATQAP